MFICINIFVFFVSLLFVYDLKADDNEAITIPEIEIQSSIGDRTRLTPGSTNYVDRTSMDKTRPLTVGEILQEIPGVISEIDDGDTRKSNFGIRGAHSRRSRKISVYEDYIPNNFAPYTDPTTHYTPPDERIAGVEVIKGSGQLTHGPQTMHGIINFLNHRPPLESTGKIITSLGNNHIGSRKQLHIRYGQNFGIFGNWQGMFTRHDNRGPVHGDIIDYNDYFINGDIDLSQNQKLSVTLNYNEENSEYAEGGLGLYQYNADAYMGNKRKFDDTFEMDMFRVGLAHSYFASDTFKIDTNFYYNFIYRTRWSQTDNESSGLVSRQDIGCTNENTMVQINITNAGCGYKNTPRRYHTSGIETRFYKDTNWFGKTNNLRYGIKFEFEKLERKARIEEAERQRTYELAQREAQRKQHLEYCNKVALQIEQLWENKDKIDFDDYLLYDREAILAYYSIERKGIKVSDDVCDVFDNRVAKHISNNKLYSDYFLNTTTGRPSNSFGSINFAALESDKRKENWGAGYNKNLNKIKTSQML